MSEGGLGRLLGGVGASLTSGGHMPGFAGATGWLNSQPLGEEDLRGRVVLVDFWTYTCINWLRTLGHVRAWADRYRDLGLTVVGVHTPEFPFERDAENVRWAVEELDVDYPVAIDSEYAIWGAFANRYWPAVYIVDASGRIRHHQFGEGGYDECERIAQRLLREAGRKEVPDDLVAVADEDLEAQADWEHLRSPETYLNERPAGVAPAELRLNEWTLSGAWSVEARSSVLEEPGGAIAFCFHARDVNLVLGPPARDAPAIPFRVLVDGDPPGANHGLDVDELGNGEVIEQRLYQLVRQRGPIADRIIEITFTGAGVEAYVFTFG